MAKRQIKDALVNGESVYFKGHAQATYMSSGITVEDAINNVGTNIDLTNYATKTEIPTKVSQLGNDSKFISAVDTGEEVGDVEVNYVTEAELTSELAKKQPTLVSGTNIKTINGTSILGSGDIVIEGGSSSGGNGAYAEVNHGTSDTTFALTPNTFHVWDEVASLDLSFADEQAGIANEYLFQFTSGATATTLTLPDNILWMNELEITKNKIYQISILKGLASVLSFEKEKNLIENHVTATPNGNIVSVSTEYPVNSNIEVLVNTGAGDSILTIQKGENYAEQSVFMAMSADILNITPSEDDVYIYKF